MSNSPLHTHYTHTERSLKDFFFQIPFQTLSRLRCASARVQSTVIKLEWSGALGAIIRPGFTLIASVLFLRMMLYVFLPLFPAQSFHPDQLRGVMDVIRLPVLSFVLPVLFSSFFSLFKLHTEELKKKAGKKYIQ